MKTAEAIKKAEVLIEALPYLKEFHKKIFVIKYGGSILAEKIVRDQVLEDIVFLAFAGIRPVLVHGGGPRINERLKKEGIKSDFHEGIRKTPQDVLLVVEEELNSLNRMLVQEMAAMQARVRGFVAEDRIFLVKKKKAKVDLGFVGDITNADVKKVFETCWEQCIPVISPMGMSTGSQRFNINADEAASHLAGALRAEKFIILTNVRGILRSMDDPESLFSSIDEDDAEKLIEQEVIKEGMIPKVRCACRALDGGVKKVHMVDARIPHSLLLEIFTDEGVGTEIVK